MNLSLFTLMAAQPAAAQGETSTAGAFTSMLFPLLMLAFVFYFIIYRPQKKQEKEVNNMRNSLAVGDEITLNSGIIGKVLNIKDDTITIETGADRVRIKVRKWALHSIDKKVGEAPAIEAAPEKKEGFKVKSVKKKTETVEATENKEQ